MTDLAHQRLQITTLFERTNSNRDSYACVHVTRQISLHRHSSLYYFLLCYFCRAMHSRAIPTVSRTSACLSVCPSVCNVDVRDHISWVSAKVTIRIISLGSSPSEPQHRQSSPRGTPPKFAWSRNGAAVLSRKPEISLKRGKIDQGYYCAVTLRQHVFLVSYTHCVACLCCWMK